MKHTSNARRLKLFTSALYFFSIFLFINAFNFQHNPPSGWQQQFLPFLNNRPLADMDFVDSLLGFGVTGDGTGGDTNHIIKTTNGGEKWFVVQSYYKDLTTIKFLNSNTGFACGGLNGIGAFITKTTDAGILWTILNGSPGGKFLDMHVLSEDTIWGADAAGLVGGLWRTTDGGASWLRQYGGVTGNPEGIYMYNAKLGFMSRQDNTILSRTTDGGFTWSDISGVRGFTDLHFSDSLNGWKADGNMKRTFDGGITWNSQILPATPSWNMREFSVPNSDSIWGAGGFVDYPGIGYGGIVYITTNGGLNWGYQIPDTAFTLFTRLLETDFVNSSTGWIYAQFKGVHTTTGGDTNTIFTGIENSSSPELISSFELLQNYPNPFNPSTRIVFRLRERGFCRLAIFDIAGREVRELFSREYSSGEWETEFDGSGLPGGVYFARLEFTAKNGIVGSDVLKMLLVK